MKWCCKRTKTSEVCWQASLRDGEEGLEDLIATSDVSQALARRRKSAEADLAVKSQDIVSRSPRAQNHPIKCSQVGADNEANIAPQESVVTLDENTHSARGFLAGEYGIGIWRKSRYMVHLLDAIPDARDPAGCPENLDWPF